MHSILYLSILGEWDICCYVPSTQWLSLVLGFYDTAPVSGTSSPGKLISTLRDNHILLSHPGPLVGGKFYIQARRVAFGEAGNRPLLYLL